MTTLFLVHSEQDGACAARLRLDLTTQGYAIAEGSGDATETGERQRAWEQAMQASGAVILVWSAAASRPAGIAQRLDYARWLYKHLLVLTLDGTALPGDLGSVTTVASTPPWADAASLLRAHLPSPQGSAQLNSLPVGQPSGEEARPQLGAPHGEAQHIFGVRCPDGHVSYFDKREVCRPQGLIKRTIRDGKELDELLLACSTCNKPVVVEVDCEGYR